MKKNVTISIIGTYSYDDDEPEVIELFTTGEFYREGEVYFITYQESEATGFEGSLTTLKVENQECVTVQRTGNENSQLVVQNGVRHQCHYDTGYGDMMIGVSGHSIKSSLSDEGGQIEFKYSLDINSMVASENEMLVVVNNK